MVDALGIVRQNRCPMRLRAALFLTLLACVSASSAASADPVPADTAAARILAEADSIRARQAREAEVLARADSIRKVPHPDSLAFRQLQYESQKKSIAVGVGLGLLLPGLGNFYANDPANGVFILGWAVIGAALSTSDDEGVSSWGNSMFVVAVVASPVAGGIAVGQHNKKLRKKLQLEVAATSSGRPALVLAEHF